MNASIINRSQTTGFDRTRQYLRANGLCKQIRKHVCTKLDELQTRIEKDAKPIKQLNLEIFDSEGDRGIKEDDGKDAGEVNSVTLMMRRMSMMMRRMTMLVTNSDNDDYDNCDNDN